MKVEDQLLEKLNAVKKKLVETQRREGKAAEDLSRKKNQNED